MKTIAVTGINGFIASSVSRMLLDNGYNIIGLSIEEKAAFDHPNLKYIQVDITNWLQVQSVFAENEFDMLLHFAGIAHVIKGQKITNEMYKRVNYLASKNLFRCAHSKDIKVFFASSVDVYGACREHVWREDAVPIPVGIYAKTKYMAECCLREIYRDKESKYLIGRFAPVYSVDNTKDVYKRVYIKYPKLSIEIKSNPSYTFLSLDNLVNFVLFWVKSDFIKSNLINVCDESEITSQEFILLEKEAGKAQRVIKIPNFISRTAVRLSNWLLYSGRKSHLGFSMIKLFDPRTIDKTAIKSLNCCSKNIREILYSADNAEFI